VGRTRCVKIGKCTVKFTNVPDSVSEEELRSMALVKLFDLNRKKAEREMMGLGKAS